MPRDASSRYERLGQRLLRLREPPGAFGQHFDVCELPRVVASAICIRSNNAATSMSLVLRSFTRQAFTILAARVGAASSIRLRRLCRMCRSAPRDCPADGWRAGPPCRVEVRPITRCNYALPVQRVICRRRYLLSTVVNGDKIRVQASITGARSLLEDTCHVESLEVLRDDLCVWQCRSACCRRSRVLKDWVTRQATSGRAAIRPRNELRTIYREDVGDGLHGAEPEPDFVAECAGTNRQLWPGVVWPAIEFWCPAADVVARRPGVRSRSRRSARRPTVSPYLNLFREDFDGGGDFNYQTLVRPAVPTDCDQPAVPAAEQGAVAARAVDLGAKRISESGRLRVAVSDRPSDDVRILRHATIPACRSRADANRIRNRVSLF